MLLAYCVPGIDDMQDLSPYKETTFLLHVLLNLVEFTGQVMVFARIPQCCGQLEVDCSGSSFRHLEVLGIFGLLDHPDPLQRLYSVLPGCCNDNLSYRCTPLWEVDRVW